ncbi:MULTISPECIES: hypothetical protein [unclassified Bradyrhizobium]
MIVRRMPSFLELAPIRVNVFSPGLTATPTWSGMSEGNRETMFGNAARICQRAAWGGSPKTWGMHLFGEDAVCKRLDG